MATESPFWNTKYELEWLRDLGKRIHSETVFTARKVLLKRYRQTIGKRRWNKGVDVDIIREYLRRELR
jgi:hypothetical protein